MTADRDADQLAQAVALGDEMAALLRVVALEELLSPGLSTRALVLAGRWANRHDESG